MSYGGNGSMLPLFPAYAKAESSATPTEKAHFHEENSSDVTEDSSWLRNASFANADASRVQIHAQSDETFKRDPDNTSPVILEELHYVSSSDSVTGEEKTKLDSSRHHKKKKKKKKHKKHKKHKHKHDEDYSHNKRQKVIPGLIAPVPGKVFIEDIPKQDDLVVFSLDKTPDRNNFTYDSIYKGNIAQHHTIRQCLGSNEQLFLKPPKSSSKRKGREEQGRYYQLGSRKKKQSQDEEANSEDVVMVDTDLELEVLHTAKPARGEMPVIDEYLPLVDEKTLNTAPDTSTSTGETPQEPGDKRSGETRAEYIRRTTEDYNKGLAKNPHDIELWLKFINFQDETFKGGGDLGIGKSRKEIDRLKRQESLAFQMKQAIFERALKENPGCVKLKLEHLTLCSDFLDQSNVVKDWKELLFQHPNNLMVWQKYLEFAENRIGTFSVTRLTKAYKKCLHVLKGIESGKVLSHPPKPGTKDLMIAIFVKLCYRLQQAGHWEKAVGLFQAQLEFNLFQPVSMKDAGRERQMDFFTAFWESDAPRLGEDGAQGWAHWIDAKGQVPPFMPQTSKQAEEELEESLQQQHSTKYDLWQAMETSRSGRRWLPWRPDPRAGETMESCEDPEGLVLADDVTYALFSLGSDEQKFHLLCHFLLFLGLPNPEDTFRKGQTASEVCQVKGSTFLENLSQLDKVEESQKVDGCFAEKLENRMSFIENVFRQMFPIFKVSSGLCDILFSLYLDFLLWMTNKETEDPKKVIKETKAAAKMMLQEEQYRSNMFSWQQFALMEYRLGNMNGARKVLNNTIAGLASSLDSISSWKDRATALLLYRTYAEIELGVCSHVQKEKVLGKSSKKASKASLSTHVLVSMCDSFSVPEKTSVPSATHLLKCRRHFECKIQELVDVFTPSQEMDSDSLSNITLCLEHWVTCYTLFLYLTSGLEAATISFQEVASRILQSRDKLRDIQRVPNREESESQLPLPVSLLQATLERLTEVHVRLLLFNLEHSQAPLKSLREPLEQAIECYPDNVALLSRYVSLELRSSFTGHLRQKLSKICRKTKDPQVWIIAILAEITKIQKLQMMSKEGYPQCILSASMSLPEVGLVHVVRTWFERAVTACYDCALLWRLYLQFEVKYGKHEAVKAVFYRAVQHCPWAKTLYMDYISSSVASLEEAVDLMTEKELRVHTPLEEIDILLEPSLTPPDSPS